MARTYSPRRPKHQIDLEKFTRMYRFGCRMRTMAEYFGCSLTTLKFYRDKLGLEKRPVGNYSRRRR